MLLPGVAINGRVVFEGAQPTAAELQDLSIALIPSGGGGRTQTTARVSVNGTFTFAGVVPEAYYFATTWNAIAAASKWTLKAAVANGREAFEVPLRVTPNEPVNWVLTFTDKPATLSGTVEEPGGRAATDYFILVFSVDRRYWTPGTRRIRTTRPATDGSFTVKGLPSGQYYLAALTDLESGEWNDPALLEQLVPTSAQVTVRDGETTTRDFHVGPASRQDK
jgi:hypothetical protein